MSGFPQAVLNPIAAGVHNFPNPNGVSTNFGAGLGSSDGRVTLGRAQGNTIAASASVTNSTVFVNSGLAFMCSPILTTWAVTYVLRFTAPNPNGDLKLQLTGPAGFAYHFTSARVDATGATVLIDDSTGTLTVQGGGATVRTVIVNATVVGGLVTGLVNLQFAQNTANATATVITANSTQQYQQISEFVSTSQGQRFRVAMIGDSITDGTTLGAYNPQYWGTWFRRYIAGILGLPDGGPGFRNALRNQATMEFSRTGVWSNPSPGDNTLAYNKAPAFRLNSSTDNTAVLTYTKPSGEAQMLRAELAWIDGPLAGDMQVSLDGGPFIPLGLGPSHNNDLKTFAISQPFASTIAFRNDQAGGTMFPVGLNLYDGLSGVVVDNYGFGGTVAGEHLLGTGGADACRMPAVINVPRLTFVQFGANEMILGNGGTFGTANALANYSANMTSIVQRFQAFGDVIVLFGPRMQVGSAFSNLTTYGSLEIQARAVAAAANVPFIDVAEAWGDWTVPNAAGLMQDAYHPNAAGSRNIASRITAAISAAVT